MPFVPINCGALSPALLESTLFGHKKGAFTGALRDTGALRRGRRRHAVPRRARGHAPLLQVKLLRVLETGELLPVGASRPITVDVRLVSATHRPLEAMVADKSFRDDLYWRVRGIEIVLPRLADRTGICRCSRSTS
jgi:transcriptional regulator with PAS, ATPase and Fis domain